MQRRTVPGACFLIALMLLFACLSVAQAPPALAQQDLDEFVQSLSAEQRREFDAYIKAQRAHEARLDAFWDEVVEKRAQRRKKKASGDALTPDDYVRAFPPEYKGPELSRGLARRWAKYQAKSEPSPRRPVPTLADYLANAAKYYDFKPDVIAEREFKLRYAREAMAHGLTKEQVVRVYALETGGQGTADMQAGINPISKKGRPISSALGYAQLLDANSVDELSKHGDGFLARLRDLAAAHRLDRPRAAALEAKIASLKRMIAAARSIPRKWSAHVAFAATPKGSGIHALNLDGDIGPWLQAVKLKGLKLEAERAGVTKLEPHEMELMNLAGPGTGLEMMLPVARNMPTVNFFSRLGYTRNPIVHGRTAAELLAAIDRRMDENVGKPGAVEFAAAFDEIARERRAGR